MLSRVNSLFNLFYYTINFGSNNEAYDDFKNRLYAILNVRYHIETDNDLFTQNLETLQQLMQEAKNNKYNLNTYNKDGYSFVNQVIIRHTQTSEHYCIAMLELLIANGADLNLASLDARQNVPLISATRRGMAMTVEWLLSHNANPMIKDRVNGLENKTACDYVSDAILHHETKGATETSLRLKEIQNLLIKFEPRFSIPTI